MNAPRLLDLFCGAGGAAMGYHRAGFDVTGVDNRPQPRYPFTFRQDNALDYLRWMLDTSYTSTFDAIHASPPCQLYSITHKSMWNAKGGPDLLPPTRALLEVSGLPWVIENVPGAPMRADYRLCGCMFNLRADDGRPLIRQRWFETSWLGFVLRPPCYHTGGRAVTVAGNPGGVSTRDGYVMSLGHQRREAMAIDWMTQAELSQAIPPAYTEYIGRQLLDHIAQEAVS